MILGEYSKNVLREFKKEILFLTSKINLLVKDGLQARVALGLILLQNVAELTTLARGVLVVTQAIFDDFLWQEALAIQNEAEHALLAVGRVFEGTGNAEAPLLSGVGGEYSTQCSND